MYVCVRGGVKNIFQLNSVIRSIVEVFCDSFCPSYQWAKPDSGVASDCFWVQ